MKNLLAAPPVPKTAIDDCWQTIGVHGDRSCAELEKHTHCRNCPVYAAAATKLLDVEPSADYIANWTTHFAAPHTVTERDTQSVVIFRIGREWLALPTSVVREVAPVRPVHSLPQRRGGLVEGLANIDGQLLITVRLGQLLGFGSSAGTDPAAARRLERLMVLRRDDARIVFRADEVHGVHRFHPRELKSVPSTVARATASYSKDLLPWNDHSVGVLDAQLLFYTLKRSLS